MKPNSVWIVELRSPKSPKWKPYLFFTTKREALAAMRNWRNSATGDKYRVVRYEAAK